MDLKQAMLDPASVFATPEEVCEAPSLTPEQKIKILRRWVYDARQLEVAEEENMGGGPGEMLDRVLAALRRLGAEADPEHAPPTKLGGT